MAWQDLATEFKGRQGLVLPGLVLALLLPAAAIPDPTAKLTADYASDAVEAYGDVPPEVAALPAVAQGAPHQLRFERTDDGLLLHGPLIPDQVRSALDAGSPAIEIHRVERGYVFPGRTLLFALVTASTLTGAVSQSIGGERSRKTLVVLLAAAITRAEIVLGKWVAWGGFGAATSLFAATAAVLLGNARAGWWLAPLPWVPLASAAIGFWLVRRAGDVMAGSATTLRVLPAALSIGAALAWLAGDGISPWVGALVPIGGALIAAGDTWPGAGPPLVAAASTAALTAVALAATVRDLEESSDRDPPQPWFGQFALATGFGALMWWFPVAGPHLWTPAGNRRITAALPVEHGLVVGALLLGMFSAVRAARAVRTPSTPGARWPRARDGIEGAVGAVALAAGAAAVGALPPLFTSAWADRFDAGLRPDGAGPVVVAAVILADEWMFRGWLPRAVGPIAATVAFVIVRAPTDPALGLWVGAVCAALAARTGSPYASLVARFGWLAIASLIG
ncbi:MAG: ABC transporter permease subunit [Myxococcota bacterium]